MGNDPGMPTPLLTVVMPLYNKANEVCRAIESVRRQTVQDIAVCVVDDGSTDGSADIVRQLHDPKITLICQPNRGASAARNRGIAASSTELVAFLDSDDEWKPEFLETTLDLHRRFPQAALAAAGYTIITEKGRTMNVKLVGVPMAPQGGLIKDYLRCIADGGSPVCSSNTLGKKSVFQEVGGFPEGERLAEDWDTWCRIALRYTFAFSPGIKAVYRMDASNRSILHSFNEQETCLMRTLRSAIAAPEPATTTHASIKALLYKHLVVVAEDCITLRKNKRARQLLREARTLGEPDDKFTHLWQQSYMTSWMNRTLRALKKCESACRHWCRDHLNPKVYESKFRHWRRSRFGNNRTR